MKTNKFFLLFALLLTAGFFGCKENTTDPGAASTDAEAIQQITVEDSTTLAFDANFNEESAMSFGFGKTQEAIYPIRIGRRVTAVTRTFSQEIVGDSAYVTVTSTFTGTLIIAASRDSVAPGDTTVTVDTLISKPFTSQIIRKLILAKVRNTPIPRNNWKIVAVSLPAGGTSTTNVAINKATITLQNGESIVITNPNEFFFSRNLGGGNRKDMPYLNRNSRVTLTMEITSSYNDEDFVMLTYGANFRGLYRIKRRLELVSSTAVTGGFLRVYSGEFWSGNLPGHFHAVVDLTPRGVLFDDAAPVESKVWGLPYMVR